MSKKKVKQKIQVQPKGKEVSIDLKINPDSDMSKNLGWQFNLMDFDEDSNWNWNQVGVFNSNNEIFRKLCDLESMKLSEVNDKKNHKVGIENITKIAQRKLADKKLDDIDGLHSFHVKGSVRIYCIPDGNIMKLLWYDIYHADEKKGVCPYHKKGT